MSIPLLGDLPKTFRISITFPIITEHIVTKPNPSPNNGFRVHEFPFKISWLPWNFRSPESKDNRKINPNNKSLRITISIYELLPNFILKKFNLLSKSIHEKSKLECYTIRRLLWYLLSFFDVWRKPYFQFCSHSSFLFSFSTLLSISLLNQNSSF